MENYTLKRFVKLNIYLLASYTILTGIAYAVMGKFSGPDAVTWNVLLFNASVFSLFFSLTLLVWFRRTDIKLATTRISYKELQQQLREIGYEPVPQPKKTGYEVYKPVPPKAAALAGKIFVQKTANFYIIEGPHRFLKKLEDK